MREGGQAPRKPACQHRKAHLPGQPGGGGVQAGLAQDGPMKAERGLALGGRGQEPSEWQVWRVQRS